MTFDLLSLGLSVVLVYICGNLAGRVDQMADKAHKLCDYKIQLYYNALVAASYLLNKDKPMEILNQLLENAKNYQENIKHVKF